MAAPVVGLCSKCMATIYNVQQDWYMNLGSKETVCLADYLVVYPDPEENVWGLFCYTHPCVSSAAGWRAARSGTINIMTREEHESMMRDFAIHTRSAPY